MLEGRHTDRLPTYSLNLWLRRTLRHSLALLCTIVDIQAVLPGPLMLCVRDRQKALEWVFAFTAVNLPFKVVLFLWV